MKLLVLYWCKQYGELSVCVENRAECSGYNYCYVENSFSLNLLWCQRFAMSSEFLFNSGSGLASKIASFFDKQKLHIFIPHLYAIALLTIDHFMAGLCFYFNISVFYNILQMLRVLSSNTFQNNVVSKIYTEGSQLTTFIRSYDAV